MPSPRRLEKLNIFLREEISRILNRELEFPEGNLITVTRAEISSDGRYAAVFLSVLGQNQEKILEILQKNIYNIQQKLNKRLRIRPVPKIRFMIDEAEISREAVEKSLADLKKREEL